MTHSPMQTMVRDDDAQAARISAQAGTTDASADASAAAGASAATSAGDETCELKYASPEAVRDVRETLVSDRAAAAMAATFSVLGDPTRVRLLDALARRELCVCELAELVSSSESAVSHQLRLLRSLRLVRSRRSGRMIFYTLDDEHIRQLLDQSRRHIEETQS
jgi:ArsR family transcriptional regulator, lead/cadmium/zinc/bismuth-responsive transcriptional repressor